MAQTLRKLLWVMTIVITKFVMISDATDTASVISGTAGTLVANIEGDTSGTHTGAVSGNITSTGTQ